MAKSKHEDGPYEAKPKADVYMVLIILTFFAMLVATGLMYLEASSLQP